MPRRSIEPKGTLLFFDEVQECDQSIASLKYFRQDAPEYDVIATGSLLGVHVARQGSLADGYVDMLTMHPMDFEEFCWAMGEERAFDVVRSSFASRSSCSLHDHMMGLYRDYLLVGGMSEVVAL